MPEISARPAIDLKVDNKDIVGQKIVRMRVTQSYDGPDQLEFEFMIPAGDNEPVWSPNKYTIGSEIEASMGYDGDPGVSSVFKGVVTRVDGLFGDPNRNQSLRGKIVANCKLHFLSRIRKTMHWEKVTYSKVVDELAKGAGISPGADSTDTTFDYVSVNSQNWLSFATELARRVGFRLSYEDDSLVFAAPEFGEADDVYCYGKPGDGEKGLLSVKFRADTAGLHDEVSVLAYDDKDKKQIIGKKAAADISHSGKEDGVKLLASKFAASPLWITNYAARSQAEVDELAQALLDDIAFEFCSCEGELAGDPLICPTMVLDIKGVTPNFMGKYYITKVIHEFIADVSGATAGGYRTKFTGMKQSWEGVK